MTAIKRFVDLVKENQKPGMVVAEIGVFDGETTKEYVETIHVNKGTLYVVDWFQGNVNAGGIHSFGHDPGTVLQRFKDNTNAFHDCIVILSGTSDEKIKEIPYNSLDICFIDADHRYTNVFNDIKNCLPKMKKGGILCGHDCEDIKKANTFEKEWLEKDYINNMHCGVIQAVYDHFGYDVEILDDWDGCRVSIWLKRII